MISCICSYGGCTRRPWCQVMRILLADDDLVSCQLLQRTLNTWGHSTQVVHDGVSAWNILSGDAPPDMAILDWTMPGMDGPEICQRVQAVQANTHPGRPSRPYLMLLTAHSTREHVIAGLESGADDYLTKPYDLQEMRARINVGIRVLTLQEGLARRIQELEKVLAQVRQLQGLLPICMYCKKIRVDSTYWQQVEAYIAQHTEARFTHGICPDCYKDVVMPEVDRLKVP